MVSGAVIGVNIENNLRIIIKDDQQELHRYNKKRPAMRGVSIIYHLKVFTTTSLPQSQHLVHCLRLQAVRHRQAVPAVRRPGLRRPVPCTFPQKHFSRPR